MSVDEMESLTGGTGVHVFLVLWKGRMRLKSTLKKASRSW